MDVHEDLVRHVAQLARLELTDAEVTAMAPKLQDILQYVERVQGIDVDDDADPATTAPIDMDDLRDDVPGETLDVHDVMRGAPASDGAFFVVPRVFDREDESASE